MMLLHIVFIGGAAGSLMGSVWLFTSEKILSRNMEFKIMA